MTTQIKAIIIVAIVAVLGIGAYALSADSTEPVTTIASTTAPTQPSSDSDSNDETINNSQKLTVDSVAEHDKQDDCWTIINGSVYDITEYIPRHPGGDEILKACGTDGTSLFTTRTTDEGEAIGSGTPHSSNASRQLESFLVGTLE